MNVIQQSAISWAARAAEGFFAVIQQAQTYRNLLYLLVAAPLGVVYLLYLLPALLLSIVLSVTGVGLFLLVVVFGTVGLLVSVERWLASALLRVSIAPGEPFEPRGEGLWAQLNGYAGRRATWIGIGYLLAKLPLAVTLSAAPFVGIAFAGTLAASPVLFLVVDIDYGFWRIDSWPETAIAVLTSLPVLAAVLHVANGAAWLWSRAVRIVAG